MELQLLYFKSSGVWLNVYLLFLWYFLSLGNNTLEADMFCSYCLSVWLILVLWAATTFVPFMLALSRSGCPVGLVSTYMTCALVKCEGPKNATDICDIHDKNWLALVLFLIRQTGLTYKDKFNRFLIRFLIVVTCLTCVKHNLRPCENWETSSVISNLSDLYFILHFLFYFWNLCLVLSYDGFASCFPVVTCFVSPVPC